MHQKTVSLILFIFCSMANSSIGGQEVQVDREELENIGDHSIRFINYVGPYEFTSTLEQIRDIGRGLADQITIGQRDEALMGGKYRVIHIVRPDIKEGLDADVFILEENALVDHITNLRAIIAAYLETLYGFTRQDAFLIAEFASFYNAVFRGDTEMVDQRYKAPVGEVLDPLKIGLDTHYINWPGKTEMLIPLRGGGELPKIDTSALSDEKVIDEMRREEDMGLESRRDMIDLRERELDEEQKRLDAKQEELKKQEEIINKELEELEQKEAEGDLSSSEEQEREILKEQKAAVDDELEALEEEKEGIDERIDEVLKMRDDVAEDENTLIEESQQVAEVFVSAAQVSPIWFLTVDDEGNGIPFGRVVKYDLDSGDLLAESEVTSVRGRTLLMLPDSVLVIAGKEGGNSSVRPMLLSRDSLETQNVGEDEIYPGSLMTVRGSEIYLVTLEEGEWRIGKFDTNLKRLALSETAVEPWTSINFEGQSIYVQSEKGEILKLSARDFREEARLR